MPRIIIIIGLILASVAAGLYYQFNPTSHYRRNAEHLLNSLSEAVESQNRASVATALDNALDDTAAIALEVDFPTPRGQVEKNATKQNFTKKEFLSFIDNVLYTVKDYHSKISIDTFNLSMDKKTGTLDFFSHSSAQDVSETNINIHYIAESKCSAELRFSENGSPKISGLSCVAHVQYGMMH